MGYSAGFAAGFGVKLPSSTATPAGAAPKALPDLKALLSGFKAGNDAAAQNLAKKSADAAAAANPFGHALSVLAPIGAALAPLAQAAISVTPLSQYAPVAGDLLRGDIHKAAHDGLATVGLSQYADAADHLLDGDVKGAFSSGAKAGLNQLGLGQYATAAQKALSGDTVGALNAATPALVASIQGTQLSNAPLAAQQQVVAQQNQASVTSAVNAAIASKPYGAVFHTRAEWEAFANNPLTAGGTIGHPKR